MTKREEIQALRREVAELRGELAALRLQVGQSSVHHVHYPPGPAPVPSPTFTPWLPLPQNVCASQSADLAGDIDWAVRTTSLGCRS